jgi:two-component sensor histidine kinase
MLTDLLAAYAERIAIEGDDISIDDRSATPLALLFHELATNAAKYGALSSSTGSVRIVIAPDKKSTVIAWEERGGPAVVAPSSDGFGTKLIELSAVRQLSGQVERDWASEGLRLQLTMPASALNRAPVPVVRRA